MITEYLDQNRDQDLPNRESNESLDQESTRERVGSSWGTELEKKERGRRELL